MSDRGYCGIGVFHSKADVNIGTLWRSALAFGADFVFTVGRRYSHQSSDKKAWRHLPVWHFADLDELPLPLGAELVGVEIDARARTLPEFTHPERGVYLLGAEDHGLSRGAMERCGRIVSIPGASSCLNVATAGSIVLYDRVVKTGKGEV